MDKIDELLTRGVANIIPGKPELKKLLESGEKLNIYFGIDPTATRIHLGHAVPIRKLQAFAQAGHHVTFLIGDFTALIGDTSDKESERPVLTSEEIETNFQTYKSQAEKILDFSKIKVVHNSEWLDKLGFRDLVKLIHEFTLNDFISRELIRKRLGEGKVVGLLETIYPLMQGYDSFFMDTDLQIGGTDQTFNMQAGRTLQKRWRNKESFVLTTPILESTDGKKMSKTSGNAIWLEDTPDDMYAKIMAIRDDLIVQYAELATNVSFKQVEKIKQELQSGMNPMNIKKHLAEQIVSELHDKNAAEEAAENFAKIVQQKVTPTDIPTFEFPLHGTITDILLTANLASSKAEAKRLIEQGGVSVDDEIIKDPDVVIETSSEKILRVGRRRFVKIVTKV